jgi:hypothetical protein
LGAPVNPGGHVLGEDGDTGREDAIVVGDQYSHTLKVNWRKLQVSDWKEKRRCFHQVNR